MPAALFVPPAPVVTSAVFGVTEDLRRFRLSNATTNDEAVKEWYRLDDERFYTTKAQTINGVRVRFYAVRDINDPEWADAPEGEVVTHVLKPHHFLGKGGAPLKAVRDYAAAEGITGREGGWLYREDGSTVTQGWASFTHSALKRLRLDGKCVDAALAHHFAVKAPQPRTRKQDPKKLTRVTAGHYATVDGTVAIVNDGLGRVPQSERDGSGIRAGVTGNEWAVVQDPEGRLREDHNGGDHHGDWFDTKREAIDFARKAGLIR